MYRSHLFGWGEGTNREHETSFYYFNYDRHSCEEIHMGANENMAAIGCSVLMKAWQRLGVWFSWKHGSHWVFNTDESMAVIGCSVLMEAGLPFGVRFSWKHGSRIFNYLHTGCRRLL